MGHQMSCFTRPIRRVLVVELLRSHTCCFVVWSNLYQGTGFGNIAYGPLTWRRRGECFWMGFSDKKLNTLDEKLTFFTQMKTTYPNRKRRLWGKEGDITQSIWHRWLPLWLEQGRMLQKQGRLWQMAEQIRQVCIAYWTYFARLLAKTDLARLGHGVMTSYKNRSPAEFFPKSWSVFNTLTCHFLEWRRYAWFRSHDNRIWTLTLYLALSNVIWGDWPWLTDSMRACSG